MRRVALSLSALVAIVMVLSVPREASAQGWWRWIEQLSGPGPLWGPQFEVALTCIPDNASKGQGSRGLGCDSDPDNTVKAVVRLNVAWLSGKNNLRYAPGTSVPENVRAFSLQGAVDVVVRKWLDIGVSVGSVRFSNTPADSFSKPVIEPVRVTVKPFASKTDLSPVLRAIQIRFSGVVFPGGFTAEDFGAVPGSFDAGVEFLKGISVGVDFLSIIRGR